MDKLRPFVFLSASTTFSSSKEWFSAKNLLVDKLTQHIILFWIDMDLSQILAPWFILAPWIKGKIFNCLFKFVERLLPVQTVVTVSLDWRSRYVLFDPHMIASFCTRAFSRKPLDLWGERCGENICCDFATVAVSFCDRRNALKASWKFPWQLSSTHHLLQRPAQYN